MDQTREQFMKTCQSRYNQLDYYKIKRSWLQYEQYEIKLGTKQKNCTHSGRRLYLKHI